MKKRNKKKQKKKVSRRNNGKDEVGKKQERRRKYNIERRRSNAPCQSDLSTCALTSVQGLIVKGLLAFLFPLNLGE